MDVSIENLAGSTRKGVNQDGEPWEVVLPYHYGYFRGTKGADGEHLDVAVGPLMDNHPDVHIINHLNPKTGEFDEHKVFMGFPSREAAIDAFRRGRSDNPDDVLGSVITVPVEELKRWIAGGCLEEEAVLKAEHTAHVKAHYRVKDGKVLYIAGYDKTVHGDLPMASMHQRTVYGAHKEVTHYLRATDAEDRKAIEAAAKVAGVAIHHVKRAGATHHGRVGGAYDVIHFSTEADAKKVHDILKTEAEKSPESEPKVGEPIAWEQVKPGMVLHSSIAPGVKFVVDSIKDGVMLHHAEGDTPGSLVPVQKEYWDKKIAKGHEITLAAMHAQEPPKAAQLAPEPPKPAEDHPEGQVAMAGGMPTPAEMIGIGGKEWTSPDGKKHRIYFSKKGTPKLLDFPDGKVWYDFKDHMLHSDAEGVRVDLTFSDIKIQAKEWGGKNVQTMADTGPTPGETAPGEMSPKDVIHEAEHGMVQFGQALKEELQEKGYVSDPSIYAFAIAFQKKLVESYKKLGEGSFAAHAENQIMKLKADKAGAEKTKAILETDSTVIAKEYDDSLAGKGTYAEASAAAATAAKKLAVVFAKTAEAAANRGDIQGQSVYLDMAASWAGKAMIAMEAAKG